MVNAVDNGASVSHFPYYILPVLPSAAPAAAMGTVTTSTLAYGDPNGSSIGAVSVIKQLHSKP